MKESGRLKLHKTIYNPDQNQTDMNRIILGLALAATLLFSGCIHIIEELTLRADGSGSYTLTTDLSAFMSKDMKELLAEGEEKTEEEEIPIEVDSTISLSSLNPEVFASLEHPEKLSGAYLHLLMSDAQEKMIITYGLSFKQVEDINYFLEVLPKFQDEEGELLQTMGVADILPTNFKRFSMKGKKTLIRHPGEQSSQKELSEEDMATLEMLYEDGTYKSIYHFPGKIKKTTIPNAQIQGNTLIVETPLLDLLKQEAQLDGLIKFKRK